MSEGVGRRLQAIHNKVVDAPVPEWLEEASCGPAVKHLAHLAMHSAETGRTKEEWRGWVRTNVPEASDELIAEAEECMRGAGLWPWHTAPRRRSAQVPTVMDPLREEHATLLPSIEQLRTTADAVGDAALDALRRLVDDDLDFLVHRLIPHAGAEDSALYPTVQQLMGAPGATATMSRDHAEVHHLTQELGELRGRLATSGSSQDLARELRRVLYGLYAIVKVHFAKEEEIYLPLLEARLSEPEATKLFEQLEAAAGAAHEH